MCECGLCCLILFSLSIALHACKYAIHTHTYTHDQYICIGRIDSTSILGLIDSSVKCASAYLAPS